MVCQATKPTGANPSDFTIELCFVLSDCHCQVDLCLWLETRDAVLSDSLASDNLNKIAQRNLVDLKVSHDLKDVTVLSLAVGEVFTFAVCGLAGEVFKLLLEDWLIAKLR